MAAFAIGQAIIFSSCCFFFFILHSFFLAYSQPSQICCLPYFHTRCGPSANLGCGSETCCTQLAGNAGRKKIAKNSPSAHHRTNLSDHIFATEAHIDNRKKMLNSNIFSTYSHNMVHYGPITAEICWRVWGTPAQRVSRLGSVTARHSGSGCQPNFAALNRGRHLYSAGRPTRLELPTF